MNPMDVDSLEKEAKRAAQKHVSNLLQRPDQLEKVDQYIKRAIRKKASVEGMLKSAMQTQLDGVKTGKVHLKTSLEEIQDIKKELREIEETFPAIPNLVDKLKDVREESLRHSQYGAAMENLKHIFNVPESVEKVRNYIAYSKLLLAHQTLAELERSRDDLLFQLHRLPSTNAADKNMLKHYFFEVEKVSEELGKQLWLIIRLFLNSVRKEPAVIVTALRIIEREEKADVLATKRHDLTGFVSPGRSKQWRKRVFEILEEAVTERIAGNQMEDRSQNKMWLVRHLEITRQLILEDLKVVKTACVPCFPDHYNIVDKMIQLYHRCLSAHLQEMATILEANEYVTLLNWVQIYEGPELMAHPDLNVDLKARGLEPLLPKPLIQDLTKRYLATIEKNYKEWMTNTINRELKDWSGSTPPEADDSGHYQTTTPVIVFQMIDQHLQVAKTVNQTLINKVLIISMDHLAAFAKQYKDTAFKYCKAHFEDRSLYKFFTPYMIALANNCNAFSDLAWKFRKQYRSSVGTNVDTDKAFENVLNSFEKLREDMITFLLHELFLDVDREISKVGSREWIEGKASVIENVCLTLDDYLNDYRHLLERNFDLLRIQLENKLAKAYITAILQKKMTFKDYNNREQFSRKFIRESEILKNCLAKLPNYGTVVGKGESPFECLPLLAEFLKLKDMSMLFLEVSGLIKKYPDITADHLTAIISLREDMAKTNVRKQVLEMMSELENLTQNKTKTIFSEITLS